jgi:hypothetical protein
MVTAAEARKIATIQKALSKKNSEKGLVGLVWFDALRSRKVCGEVVEVFEG